MISNFLLINGRPMPEPGAFRVKSNDLDNENSTRLENGNLQRDRIWEGARQLSCQWHGIPQSESQLLLRAVKGLEFTATYFDPEYGRISKRCYAAQWQVDYLPGTNHYGEPLWDISFDLIEASRGGVRNV